MSLINLTSTVTLGTVEGLTTPTYTYSAGMSNDPTTKVFNVTGLGGTQAGVAIHSAAKQFLTLFRRWKNYAKASKYNSVTGLYGVVPKNKLTGITIKGVNISAGQVEDMVIRTDFGIPAGGEAYDKPSVIAGIEAHIQSLVAVHASICAGSYDGTI